MVLVRLDHSQVMATQERVEKLSDGNMHIVRLADLVDAAIDAGELGKAKAYATPCCRRAGPFRRVDARRGHPR